MCGICGVLGEEKGELRILLEGLSHRGPDGVGVWHEKRKGVHLGHTRLAVIDLSDAGAQPFFYEDMERPSVLVYNGEVYNHRDLRLSDRYSRQYRSRCDTEVVYRLLCQGWISALEKFEGDFALAFYSGTRGQLLLARDRVGVKPLYLLWAAGRVRAFASEVRPLLGIAERVRLSEEGVAAFFSLGYVPGSRTPFANITKLQPGKYLILGEGGVVVEEGAYWRALDVLMSGARDVSPGEVRQAIGREVERQLQADVPVGVFLSGGLDSTIITYHTKTKKESLTYLTAVRDSKQEGISDDFAFAQEVAATWGLALRSVEVPARDLTMETIRAGVRYQPDLIADPAFQVSLELNRRAAATCRVVLTGMGADEVFGGYVSFGLGALAKSALGGIACAVGRPVCGMLRMLGRGPINSTLSRVIARYVHCCKRQGSSILACLAVNHPHETVGTLSTHAQQWLETYLEKYFGERVREWRHDMDWSQRLAWFLVENFLEKNLRYGDLAAMRWGVEGRVPLVGRSVLEMGLRLRAGQRWRLPERSGKGILRRAYAGRLPVAVLQRKKAGFGMGIRQLYARDTDPAVSMKWDILAECGGLRLEGVRSVIRDHREERADNSLQILAFLQFQSLVEEFL